MGGNRIFHHNSIQIQVGEKFQMQTKLSSPLEWHSYNAKGISYGEKNLTTASDVVHVDGDGIVVAKKTGESVVLAMGDKGKKEFYNVITK